MGGIVTIKIKSATLLETIIALTVTVFLFAFVTSFFTRITLETESKKKIRAHELLKYYLFQTEKNRNYNNEVISNEEFRINKTIIETDSSSGITKVNVSIYDSNNVRIDQMDKIFLSEKSQ